MKHMYHKTIKGIIVAAAILLVLIGCKTEQDNQTIEINHDGLKSYFANSGLPAAIMGFATRGGEGKWVAFGPSQWEKRDTISEDDIFRIFSMTKAIASVAALQLVEQGLISLDEPLDSLMPEMTSIPILDLQGGLNPAKKAITLRHLLTHTSGFGYDFLDERLMSFDQTEWEFDDLPRLFEAGDRWQYGTSLDWVGKIIEKVSGQDLENYFRQHITGPLEMDRTWFNVPKELEDNIVSWGARDSAGFQEYPRIPQEPVSEFRAGGGLFSSPHDYLTFLKCILNDGQYEGGKILEPETIDMMCTNQLPNGMTLNFGIPDSGLPPTMGHFPDENDTHGLAWAIENNEQEEVRSKGALYWSGIANTYYTLDRKKGVAIVYFTQFFPFNDKISYDYYRLFEKEVIASMDTE